MTDNEAIENMNQSEEKGFIVEYGKLANGYPYSVSLPMTERQAERMAYEMRREGLRYVKVRPAVRTERRSES